MSPRRRRPGRRDRLRWAASGLLTAFLLMPLLSSAQSEPDEKRPSRHPEFVDGLRAFMAEDWETAIVKMRQAAKIWPEDGEPVRTYGRWLQAYLPHYYIGAALYELGCYRLALEQFEQSHLSTGTVSGATTERKRFQELRDDCEIRVNNDFFAEPDDCSNWFESTEDESNIP